TEILLAALASRSCSLFSLECAAALKAVADAKQLGSRAETFNVTRPLLDPPLPPDAMGVFTSGLPLKQPANQDLELWDVARTVDADLATAVGQKKHFIDMPVLELLFSMAMKTPTLSPECSLRTSFMIAITESPLPFLLPPHPPPLSLLSESQAMKTPTLSPECSLRTSFMIAITESPLPFLLPPHPPPLSLLSDSQAMKTPTLSPECSLRTSFMSAITESPFPMDWPSNEGQGHVDGVVGGGNEGLAPQLEGFVGPIFATHGVGPSISVGDALCVSTMYDELATT
ncbi:unnamed protein product, partial [Closterium sp. NIES-64]